MMKNFMARDNKFWWWFIIGLGSVVFFGQIYVIEIYAEELSANALRVLANPPEKLKPSVQQELRKALERAARPIFQEFLPGLEDKFSYRVQAVNINTQRVIYFQAKGIKESPEVTPVTQLNLEVFIKVGGKPLKRRLGPGTQPLSMVNEKFEWHGFVSDRAAFSSLSDGGIEAFFWQKGEHYVEIRSQGDVRSIAQKVQQKLQSLNFYDFPAFLLQKDNSAPPLAVKRVAPPQKATKHEEGPVTARATEGESKEWVHKGCYKDTSSKNVVNRDVFGFLINQKDMTTEKCLQYCRGRNYRIAATQFKTWCFCGSGFGKYGKADNCDMNCAGNPYQICGGRWANSIYELTSKATSADEPSPVLAPEGISSSLFPILERSGGLFTAAKKGDWQQVKDLIAANADLEERGGNNATPLLIAAEQGHAHVVQALIAAGANLEAGGAFGLPALGMAVSKGFHKIVKMLVDAGAKREFRNDKGATFLAAAASAGHLETLKYLVGKVSTVNGTTIYRRGRVLNSSPLMAAAERGGIAATLILLGTGADPNYQGDKGSSALMVAVLRGKSDLVAALLGAGADPSAKNAEGKTVLELAKSKGRITIIEMIDGALAVPRQ